MKISDAIREAIRAFLQIGLGTARLDAEVLLADTLSTDRLALIKEPERELAGEELNSFNAKVARRLRGEPIAYIAGRKEFWSQVFAVDPRVLIPRPETELLVEEALTLVSRDTVRILDLGTGSGAIAVALAGELPFAEIVATDLSLSALKVAKANARANGMEGRISFLAGDLFSPVRIPFDIIISNPPYVASEDFPSLPGGVRDYEPPLALLGGSDGLAVIARIIAAAPLYLASRGWLIMEIGALQRDQVAELLAAAGFEGAFRRDYAGHWRVVRARMSPGTLAKTIPEVESKVS